MRRGTTGRTRTVTRPRARGRGLPGQSMAARGAFMSHFAVGPQEPKTTFANAYETMQNMINTYETIDRPLVDLTVD